MRLKAIIVDDELNAIKMLNITLGKFCPDVEVVHTCQSPVEAINIIENTVFDILFLDIQMPELNGFQMLKNIKDIKFDVIFTTAYDQYAIEAFKVNASNYLLKPVDEKDLIQAIEKVKHQKEMEENSWVDLLQSMNAKSEFNEFRISVPFSDGIEFISVKDIIYCKSDNNYTHIYLSDNSKRLISKTLKDIELKLPSEIFYRPHNSYVINLKYVSKYYRSDGGYLEMINGDHIRISRNKKDAVLNLL